MIINHDLTIQNTITVKGNGILRLLGNSLLTIQNGQLDIEDGEVIGHNASLDIQYGLHLKDKKSNLLLENGDLSVGHSFANDSGTISLINGSLSVGYSFANNDGTVFFENVCLNTGTGYIATSGTENWENVCAQIGITGSGDFQFTEGAIVTMNNSKMKVLCGNMLIATNAEISGDIEAIYTVNGNIENYATWTATVNNYCAQNVISVPNAYLPNPQDCNNIESFFVDCDCTGN